VILNARQRSTRSAGPFGDIQSTPRTWSIPGDFSPERLIISSPVFRKGWDCTLPVEGVRSVLSTAKAGLDMKPRAVVAGCPFTGSRMATSESSYLKRYRHGWSMSMER